MTTAVDTSVLITKAEPGVTILPVVAEPTGRGWVRRAGEVSVRRLADEVEWALTVRDGVTPVSPPPPGSSLEIDERQLCVRPEWEFPDAEIAFVAPPSVVAARAGGAWGQRPILRK